MGGLPVLVGVGRRRVTARYAPDGCQDRVRRNGWTSAARLLGTRRPGQRKFGEDRPQGPLMKATDSWSGLCDVMGIGGWRLSNLLD